VIPTLERIESWDGSIVEPPFVPPPDARHRKWNYWMMSQRCGSLSYLVFAAGLSLVIYAFFLWACDTRGWRVGIFRTLGTNSLAAYCLADVSEWIVGPWFPKRRLDPSMTPTGIAGWLNGQLGWNVPTSLYATQVLETGFAFFCFLLLVYLVCRLLERMGWYLRV
jgi:hypothetical protein